MSTDLPHSGTYLARRAGGVPRRHSTHPQQRAAVRTSGRGYPGRPATPPETSRGMGSRRPCATPSLRSPTAPSNCRTNHGASREGAGPTPARLLATHDSSVITPSIGVGFGFTCARYKSAAATAATAAQVITAVGVDITSQKSRAASVRKASRARQCRIRPALTQARTRVTLVNSWREANGTTGASFD